MPKKPEAKGKGDARINMPDGFAFDVNTFGPWKVGATLGSEVAGVVVTKLHIVKASFKRLGRRGTGGRRLVLEIDYDTGDGE